MNANWAVTDAASQREAVIQYLRRKYGDGTAPNIAILKAMADTAFASATQTVEITNSSGPLGTTGAVIKFDKTTLLLAIEELLRETDTANTPPDRPDYAYARFGWLGSSCPPSS